MKPLLYYVKPSTGNDKYYKQDGGTYLLPQYRIPTDYRGRLVPIPAGVALLSVIADDVFNVYRLINRDDARVTVKRVATDSGTVSPETHTWLWGCLNGMLPLLPGQEIEHYQALIGGEIVRNAPTRRGHIVKVCEGAEIAVGDLIVEYANGTRQGVSWQQLKVD